MADSGDEPEGRRGACLKDGEWVWIENDRGRCKRVLKTTNMIDERVVMSDHAWWFPEGDREDLFGMMDLNVNKLLNSYLPGKSGFGANYKSMLCKVYRVQEGE